MTTITLRPWRTGTLLPALATAFLLASCGGDGPKNLAPAAPSDVSATPGPGYITISWQDNSDDETGFEIYRTDVIALAPQQTSNKVGTVGANETSYVDFDIDLERAYSYSVVAVGEAGASTSVAAAATASVPLHVDLQMGTNRRINSDWASTLYLGYLVFPREMLNENLLTLRLDGPPGWNDGNPVQYSRQCDPGVACWVDSFVFGYGSVEAVTGDYHLTVDIAGNTYTADAHLDASQTWGFPTDLTVTDISTGGATVQWTNPPNTQVNIVSLHKGRYEGMIVGYPLLLGTEYTFDGLNLEPGEYGIEIVAVTTDIRVHPLKIEPLAQTYDYVQFTVGE